VKVQPPYEPRVSVLSPSQKAELSLLLLEGFTAAARRRIFAPQVVVFFFVWCPATTWFQAGHSPQIRKTSRALPRFPSSQRSAVSTSVKFLSRGKR
jgi:hypothetical protein